MPKHNRPPTLPGRGFTLVEMMVVIAVIGVLISILAPALGAVRHSASVTKCLSQMRQIALAHVAYTSDHDGAFADVALPHGGPPIDIAAAWFFTLQSYYDQPLVLRSPLDTSPHWPADAGGEGVPVQGTTDFHRLTSYGWNNYLSRQFTPATAVGGGVTDRLSRIKAPAKTVHMLLMATTGPFAGADHVHVENWADFAPEILAASQTQTDAVGGRAKSGDARSNYAFLDGHVETSRFAEVYVNLAFNRFDPQVAWKSAPPGG